MDLRKKKYRNSPMLKLATFFKTITQKIFQLGNRINFFGSNLKVIRHSAITDSIIFKNYITRFWIAIARLAHRTHITKGFTII